MIALPASYGIYPGAGRVPLRVAALHFNNDIVDVEGHTFSGSASFENGVHGHPLSDSSFAHCLSGGAVSCNSSDFVVDNSWIGFWFYAIHSGPAPFPIGINGQRILELAGTNTIEVRCGRIGSALAGLGFSIYRNGSPLQTTGNAVYGLNTWIYVQWRTRTNPTNSALRQINLMELGWNSPALGVSDFLPSGGTMTFIAPNKFLIDDFQMYVSATGYYTSESGPFPDSI